MDYSLINNELDEQYEFHIDGFVPRITYAWSGGKIYFNHTEVPKELGGKGIGSSLVLKALEDIRQKGLMLVPRCPFVKKYIRLHPEWKFLVANE